MLSVVDVLRSGFGAARRELRLLVPLGLGEACAMLAGLVPAGWLALRSVLAAMHVEAPDPQAALALGTLSALFDPRTWTLYLVAALFAGAAGWLLRTVLFAGALRCLAVPLERPPDAGSLPFGEVLLESPERYLAARGLAAALGGVALASATGTLVLGMARFTADPGPVSAVLMTVATGVFITLPLLMGALELGFARAALLEEGPAEALGNGLVLAWRRRSALVPAWFAFLLADVAIAVAAGGAGATIGAVPADDGRWILLLAPRALVLFAAAVARGLVSLARLGTWATLVLEDAGRLRNLPAPPPAPPRPQPIPAVLVPEEPVFDAVPVPPPDAPDGEDPTR